MSKTICIFGGAGFVGRYVARRLHQAGWKIRIPTRKPDSAHAIFKDLPDIELLHCNILDEAAVVDAIKGVDAVVHSVGTFDQFGTNNFEAIQHQSAKRVAEAARDAGVARFVYLSAIGADLNAASQYQRSKAQGEAAVLAQFEDAVILRPSVIFGPEDQFFNRFAAMTRLSPILPLVGAATRFQPVYAGDVANGVEAVLTKLQSGVFELGGPDVASFRDLMKQMLAILERRRFIMDQPMPIARLMGWGFDLLPRLSGGVLPSGPITLDQVKSLACDNVVSADAQGFTTLGIAPKSIAEILPSYLKR